MKQITYKKISILAFSIMIIVLMVAPLAMAQTDLYQLKPYTPPPPIICPPIPAPAVCPPVVACPPVQACPEPDPIPTPVYNPPSQPPPPVATTGLFKIDLENLNSSEFITFGQPFKKGDIPAGHTLAGVQLDKKSTFSDGSLRFGVISFKASAGTKAFSTAPDSTINITESLADISALDIKIIANGKTITIDTNKPTGQWLSGPVVNEWRYRQNIDTELTVVVNVRKYTGSNNIRVDVVIENSYTFTGSPKNISYDAEIIVNGASKYKKPSLNHYHRARWRKVVWSGVAPDIHVKHDIDYLLRTKAVSNYDKTQIASEPSLQNKYNSWKNSNREPMAISIVKPGMGAGGGRPDIGPLPGWATTYLLSQDKRAKEIMLSVGDLAGSYPIHYKDKNTNEPVSIKTYPNVNLYWRSVDTAKCAGICKTPFSWDKAHQPSFVFLPYLVTGDQYYIEELQYWANANHLQLPASFREYGKGLMHNMQIRGMAWSMRTLAQAAAFTPDSDTKLKTYFSTLLENNRANFETLLVGDPNNKLGVNPLGYGIPYNKFRGISVWMDGFFTWSMAYMVDLDFVKFKPLSAFKAKLPISMMTDPNACWIHASSYFLNVRDLADAKPFKYVANSQPVDYKMYQTIGRAYRESLPLSVIGKACNSQAMLDAYNNFNVPPRDDFTALNRMLGWPGSPWGQPALLQPALAVSVDLTGNIAAWKKFESRKPKGPYRSNAIWAIIPRIVQP